MRRVAVISLAGVAVLAALYPRVDESVRMSQPAWTRQQAIEAAKAFGAELGFDLSGWRFAVSAEREPSWQRLRQALPGSEVARIFEGPRYRVRAWSGSDRVTVEFMPDGRPLSWKSPASEVKVPAERVLGLFARRQAARFQSASGKEDKSEEDERSHKWEWKEKGGEELTATLAASWSEGRLREVTLDLKVPRGLRSRTEAPGRDLTQTLVGFGKFFQVCAMCVAVVFFLVQLTDRRDQWRAGLTVAAVVAAVYAVCLLLGAGTQEFRYEVLAERRSDRPARMGELLVEMFLNRSVMMAMPLAAGFMLLRGRQIQAWLAVLPLLMRRTWTPRLGREIEGGLLAAAGLVAIPYCVAAALPMLHAQVVWSEPRLLVEHLPALSYLFRFPKQMFAVFVLAATVVPWMLRPARPARWRYVLLALMALAMVSDSYQPLAGNGYLGAVVSAALVASLWLIYRRFGLVGCVSAAFGVGLLPQVVTLAWNASGRWPQLLQMAALFALPLAGAVLLSRREESELEEELAVEIARRNDPSEADRPRSERERLLTEFAVARQAQAGMLPAAPPEIDGFTLAAACIPAREVGGDLFDFLEFPEGRWGICVADVSGKGVPAALYMTLTKGMLAAEQGMASDSAALIRAVNQQLHQAGKRRTFVTMAWGLLDPATRSVDMFRAGHNPVLWWRASTQDSVYLQPKGLGLGLAGDRVFARALEAQRVELGEGDALVFYSDGLTEAMNPALELFGEDRLQEVVAVAAKESAAGLLQSILDEVERFKAGADPHDDLTLVVLRA
jgi:serine phosphatase RsbU (regulator of sigma subunit)